MLLADYAFACKLTTNDRSVLVSVVINCVMVQADSKVCEEVSSRHCSEIAREVSWPRGSKS